MSTNYLITKLGSAKGVPYSRVWIEGARLFNAGFVVGARYNRTITPGVNGRITLTLAADGKYKVSGKGTNPIVDITGKAVTDNINGTCAHVYFAPGAISINCQALPQSLAA